MSKIFTPGHRRMGEPLTGSLGLENIAMRGTQLENTEHVYGAAVYTGQDTKMSMNSKLGTNKFSTVEHSMNKVHNKLRHFSLTSNDCSCYSR